jgi:hypothetical protein
MFHPFQILPVNYRARLFAAMFILTLVVMVTLSILGEPLVTEAAPAGVISYEFAGDVSTAQLILNSWDESAKIYAGFNLGIDYLFLVFYSSTIALAIVWLTGKLLLVGKILLLATLLAWAQWLAALLDAAENASLFHMLVSQAVAPWPEIAFWCAAFKFALIILGFTFVLIAFAYQIGRSPQSRVG